MDRHLGSKLPKIPRTDCLTSIYVHDHPVVAFSMAVYISLLCCMHNSLGVNFILQYQQNQEIASFSSLKVVFVSLLSVWCIVSASFMCTTGGMFSAASTAAMTIDAIPLAVKSPSIVDWKIHKEGKKSYYQIVRADGKSQMYRVFNLMLKSFSMEDLEDLYKLVNAKYKSTRLVEDLDLVLWSDLKTMFEPHVDDEIWKLQQRYQVLSWKLFDSCEVHCLSLQYGMIYMLGRIVGIKSLLNAVSITAALIDVNAAQSKLVLLENFNENYSKCLRLLYKVNAAEGVNAASEEVSTAELVSTAYVICMRYFGIRSIKVGSTIVGIKSFLMLFGVTAALIDVHAAQSKLVLLENFNEKYSKCLRLLVKLQLPVQSYYC
ncbi:hypothetical protein Tco_1490684 [Tanacetum coccineum]